MNEKIYPSDLTDEEWEWIKDVIPAAKSGGRPRTLCMRAVLNAIFYSNRSAKFKYTFLGLTVSEM